MDDRAEIYCAFGNLLAWNLSHVMGDGGGEGGGGVCTFARALTNPSPHLRNDCTDCAEIWFSVRGAYSHKPGMYVSPANTRNYCTCMPHLNVHPHIDTS